MFSKYFNSFLIVVIMTAGIISVYQLIHQSSFFHPASQVIAEILPSIQIVGNENGGATSTRLVRVRINPANLAKNTEVTFRIANSIHDLDYATAQELDLSDPIIDWNLTSGNGQKQIYLQFRTSVGWQPPVNASVMLDTTSNFSFLTGFNIPSIVQYPYQDIRPFAHFSDVDADLKAVAAAGGSIVRVMVGDDKITGDEAAQRLGDFLNEANIYDLQVIPVLIDASSSSHNPLGTDKWYEPLSSGSAKLSAQFYQSGYRDNFTLFVRKVVGFNKQHKNLYAWEIENGLGTSTGDGFISFAEDISSTIKGIDPFHQLALGVPSSEVVGLAPLQLYNELPDVDMVSVSSTDGDQSGLADVTWARETGKAAIVDNLAVSGSDDRSRSIKQNLDFWRSHGVSAVLLGSLVAKGLKDDGDVDKQYGIDAITHSDYDAVFAALRPYGQVLGAETTNTQDLTYDLNGDGVVDSSDLEVFLLALNLNHYNKRYDFNHDGKVDVLDLSLLIDKLNHR